MSNANNDLVLHLKLDTIIPDGGNQRLRSALTEIPYTVHGNLQVVSDEHFGGCISFDGNTENYLEVPDNPSLRLSESMTISAWVYISSKVTQDKWVRIVGKGDSEHRNYGLWYCLDLRRWLFQVSTGYNQWQDVPFDKNPIEPKRWYHLAGVVDKANKQAYLYLDGKQVASNSYNATPLTGDYPLTIGYVNFCSPHNGKISNVRLYDKALSAEEIKVDMESDLTAIAAFNLAYPLDFDLYEGDNKESIIFIENDTKGEELVLEIQNDTEQGITLPAKTGAVSQNNYHFELRFRPDTLSPNSLRQLALASQNGWSMSSSVTQPDGIVSLYFLTTNTTLPANQPLTLTLQNVSASAEGGARTTRVEFLCPAFTYQQEKFTHYYREKNLSVIDHRGKKNIPLHVSFVESNRILNDGTTSNNLTLRIVNVLKDKPIPLIPDSKGDNASKFIISFDVQEANQNKDWALGTTSQVQGIEIKGKDFRLMASNIEEWKIVKETQGESPTWTITNQNEENVELRQEQGIELTISNIKSSLPSGQTNLYIRYENIPGYWDGTFICTIEKTPILYKEGNVGIGTTSPTQKLQVAGGNAAINNVFLGDVGCGYGWAGFSHINSVGLNSYAFLQDASGTQTLINAKSKSGDGFIAFRVDNQDKMKILDNGNVGIGTTSPTQKLQVAGGNAAINNVFLGDVGHGSNWAGFSHINSVGPNSYAFLQDISGTCTLINKKSGGGFIGFRVDNQDKMNILDNGNVGIGTSDPKQKLTVGNGNIQIDTGYVVGNDPNDHFLYDGKNMGHYSLGWFKDSWNPWGSTGWLSAYSGLKIFTSGQQVFSINQGGNVGIGTSNPEAKLQVINTNQDANGTTLILGPTTQSNLRLGYHQDYSWIQSHGIKPLAINPLGSNVGIGTSNPTNGKLHIEGGPTLNLGGYHYLSSKGTGPGSGSWSESVLYSLYASRRIAAEEFNAFSDARIKDISHRSDSQTDLKTLLQIEITDYSYRDTIANGNRQHKKVIGQQVAKVFPQAVSTHTDIVCDILQFAPIAEGWVTLKDHGLKTGERVKLLWEENNSEVFPVEAVTPDTFQIALDYCGEILVYGREVDDFHVVDYDALSMLHLSATQALYEIISKLQQEVEALKQQ